MPPSRTRYSSLAEMPTAIRRFILSEKFHAADAQIQKQFQLTDEQNERRGDAIMDAICAHRSLSQALADVKSVFMPAGIADAVWNDIVLEILKLEIWPLRELFGEELAAVMQEHHLSGAGWPEFRVIVKPLTYSGAASEIAARAGFSLMGQMRERLRDLIMSKVKGVRIDAQLREVLVRQSDFGGLGLDAAAADKTLEEINELVSTAEILSEDEYADRLAKQSRAVNDAPEASGRKSQAPSEDEAEIEAIKARTASSPAAVASSTVDRVVDQLVTTLAYSAPDAYLSKRLRYLTSSRLRDVRSSLELNQLLQRDVKVGGMGLSRDVAGALAEQIETGYKQFHTPIMEEEKKKLEAQLKEQRVKIEERRTREAEEHARWYREKVESRKNAEQAQKKATEQFKQAFAHPLDEKEQQTESRRFGEMVAAPQALQGHVKVSQATVDLSAAATANKPRLDDVVYGGPKLVGPIQELKEMSLAEFRRLAKDPEVAVQKIIQKLDTLEQESFERRLEGVKALQQSSFQRMYMNLVAEAFRSATPLIKLAEDKRAVGQDAPSSAELSSIISLNSALHF